MNLLCWNCRGLGSPRAIRELRELVKSFRLRVVCLIESKSSKQKCEEVRDAETIQKEPLLVAEINEWREREEMMWRQRSRAQWMFEGNNNTKYFHACASARKSANRICKLQRADGTYAVSEKDILKEVQEFYKGLFKADRSLSREEMKEKLDIIPSRVFEVHNSMLLAPYKEIEIKNAVFQIHPSKAPGVDGFDVSFFQKCWHIIESEFVRSCLDYLNDGIDIRNVNSTMIVLIPKLKEATSVKDYWPISLMGVMAKVISKVFVNRLQGIINEIISPEQGAFFPARYGESV